MLVYFTGTGNSRWCAQLLAHRLDDVTQDASGYIKNGIAAELLSEKPWVFVCPVYAWRIPRIFEDFIRAGCFSGSRDAYFVLTCGSDAGNARESIVALCREKGLRFRGVLPVVMPENYVALFSAPGVGETARILSAARPVLEAGAGRILAGRGFPKRKISALDRRKSGIVNEGFYRYYIKAKAFFATDACTGCGSCVELCPLNNIRLQDGAPVWGDACTHCMACICYCPEEAIEYGKKSRSKRRYRCPEYDGT